MRADANENDQVSNNEVERRLAEIEADPEGSTVSHEELVQFLESERQKRRENS